MSTLNVNGKNANVDVTPDGTKPIEMNRRDFVIATAAVGGGFAAGFGFPKRAGAADGDAEFNVWLVIGADDKITIRVPSADQGQGVRTSLPMIICEELNCDWTKVTPAEMPVAMNPNAKDQGYSSNLNIYGNPKWSMHNNNMRQRLLQIGASARERLRAAAAQQWNVPLAEVEAKDSVLTHKASGRKLRFGEIAAKAVQIKLDAEPSPKPQQQWTLLGTPKAKLDTPLMVNGSAKYGIDIVLPNMLYAAVKLSPVHGAKLKSFDANAIKERPGVHSVIALGAPGTDKTTPATAGSRLQAGVAVIADHYWNAKMALDVLRSL